MQAPLPVAHATNTTMIVRRATVARAVAKKAFKLVVLGAPWELLPQKFHCGVSCAPASKKRMNSGACCGEKALKLVVVGAWGSCFHHFLHCEVSRASASQSHRPKTLPEADTLADHAMALAAHL